MLRIDFRRDFLNRSVEGPHEPSDEHIVRAYNRFIRRFRRVTRTAFVRPIDQKIMPYKLGYLNDNGSEVEKKPGFIGGRGSVDITFRFAVLSRTDWTNIGELSETDELHWENLLLDGFDQLPKVGTAIVLGATAMEVFIASVLDALSKRAGAFASGAHKELWDWVNDRSHHEQEPSVEEKYDRLLKILCGRSLKDNIELWEKTKNLRTARNKFVHGGSPIIGDDVVTPKRAGELLQAAQKSFDLIREWLPEDIRWKRFRR